MKINSINNTFSGKVDSLSKLTQKAERRLQKRLTDYSKLIYDMSTDTYYRSSSGKKFTGKYKIETKDLEQFFHIKDGKLYFTLIQDRAGNKKIGGFGIGRSKQWAGPATYDDKLKIRALSEVKERVDEDMMHNFGIKQMIKNGTSIFIGSRGY